MRWQQFAVRHDPYSAIPFPADNDSIIGLVVVAAVVVVWLCWG